MVQPFKVIRVPAGVYPVGHDSVADARPRHQRNIDRPFWIDAEPVGVGMFARFVCQGGYICSEFWEGRAPVTPRSIDERCDEVRRASDGAEASRPLAGVSQLEAGAIAAFAGGRLPFETEWEIAATRPGTGMQVHDNLLEWTADVYSPVYWRADFRRRGVPWSAQQPGALVAVRGFTADALVKHVSARRGVDPAVCLPRGGFRRAWDRLPEGAEEVE